MAEALNSNLSAAELNALADRLADHADGIVNVAAHEMEQDIRLAAGVLRQLKLPPPLALLPALHLEIERTAGSCCDAATARRLRRLIGVD
jgi:acetamidase/formamidase